MPVNIVKKFVVCVDNNLADCMGKYEVDHAIIFNVDIPEACINAVYAEMVQSSEQKSKRTEKKKDGLSII